MFKLFNENNLYRQIHFQLHGKENISVYKSDKKLNCVSYITILAGIQKKSELCTSFKRGHVKIFKKC